MSELLWTVAGAALAMLLDWSIFTHLGAYLRIGFPSARSLDYRTNARAKRQLLRIVLIIVAGGLAGFALATRDTSLWVGSAVVFVIAHVPAYLPMFDGRSDLSERQK